MFNRLESNVSKNYGFILFSNINFTSGLWMIFLSKNGFSLIELGLLESFFHVGSFVFEIPSGALADIIGRKYCRIASKFAIIASLVIMYLADSFFMQAVGFMVCAFSYNLESGAGEAFLYDTLILLEKEALYKKTVGYVELFYQTAMIVSFTLGGIMASSFGYSMVFLFSICSAVVSLFIAIGFVEPERARILEDKTGNSLKDGFVDFISVLKKSVRLIKERPRIMFLIILSETIFTFTTSLFFFLQNYFKEIMGIDEFRIGLIYSAAALFSAVSSVFASRIEKIIGEKRLLLILPFLLCLCLWGIALTNFMATFFIVTGFIEGVLVVVVSDYLNKLIPSEIRATVLSVQSLFFSLVMIILFPLIGVAADVFSFRESFIFMAVIASLLSMIAFVKIKRT